jgi:hypothetical protein
MHPHSSLLLVGWFVGYPPLPAPTGGACDPLEIECVRAIASSSEGDATIVFIKARADDPARPGQWVRCVYEQRRASPPCEVLDIVDSGMLEARCGAAPVCPR